MFYLFVCARSQLQHTGSLVVACKLLVAAYNIQFPDQGSNLDPLHWEPGVLATGPPVKSLKLPFNFWPVGERSCQHSETELGKMGAVSVLFRMHEFLSSVSSVQSLGHVRLCDPMDCSMPGFPVHHQPSELAQTHMHQVGDAIQPSHPLSSTSPPAFNLSQNQGLFQ